jgi:hypothetical protein
MTTYAKCKDYNEGEAFPYIELDNNEHVHFRSCDNTMYHCYQPDQLDDEEFNLILLLDQRLVRARSSHFDFTNNKNLVTVYIDHESYRDTIKEILDGEYKGIEYEIKLYHQVWVDCLDESLKRTILERILNGIRDYLIIKTIEAN